MELPKFTSTYHHEPYPAISPSKPELSTKGKKVVITGAGTGIGAATALAFAQSGASSIALLGRTERTLLATKKAISEAYPETEVYTYVSDIVDHSSLENSLQSFTSTVGGKLDILVANAGSLDELKPVLECDETKWWSIFEVNIKGQFNLVKAFVPLAVHDAVIINVSSCVAHFPIVPKHSSYHGSKLAAIKVFDYLQAENPSLAVMQFHPGAIPTSMSQKSFDSGIPKGKADDVTLSAAFAVWCASPEARFLKGKFLWANWDVEELKAKAQELENSQSLTIGLLGWP
ncbi:hypothetical protein B0T10DRAFT_536869 [Thelonectria olida]|uniref:Uncharacterized protein n=1 Tax=Thelonectria olida TaxID=1576542 RepID=A0A9P9AUN7_9HYPO|nr:hypothetical protein B0T10DRAFT_536869 [Thelonectria olida]